MSSYYTMGGKRFKKPKEDENILRVLPSHITLEILSRLPVKTIIHCSSVCKAWHTLVLDPGFPQIHLAKSPVSLMFCAFSYRLVELEKDFPKRKLSKFNGENHEQVFGLSFEVGSCNGLLCVTNYTLDKFCVCNPVKNEYINLPRPNIKMRDRLIPLAGFGFCSRTNVYKVIRLVRYSGIGLPGMDSRKAVCEVCTLGSNAWRIIADVPVPHDGLSISKVPLNGAIHWICSLKTNGENFPLWVCAFRIEDETCDPIYLPHALLHPANLPNFSELRVLENCLSMLVISNVSLLDIWMMKEYGVRESWTKCWSIDHQGIKEMRPRALLPLRVTKDGDILMYDKFNQALVCFNPQNRVLRKQRIYGVPKGPRGIAHVASFISPARVIKEEC